MGSRSGTPSNDTNTTNVLIGSRPRTTTSRPHSYLSSGAQGGASALDQGQGPNADSSPLAQSLGKHEDGYGLSHHDDSSINDGHHNMTGGELRRSNSQMSQSQTLMPSRGGTLKKKPSLRRTGSLKRSSSRRSSRAGSVRSLVLGEKEKYGEGDEFNSAFYTPVPTAGTPTDVLINRFQAWRKVLKDLITYFRDIQKSYDVRAKTLQTAANVVNNTITPVEFVTSGGVGDATYILQDFHKQALNESNRAREIENEVIMQLTGLRSDLHQKIKEIKSLSGDFRNSVDKEVEASRKAVRHLQEALGLVDADPAATAGKGDPFIVKLGVDRQIERQIEEENYLHRAYLNLESSGRELESIVVGEIQKAYTAYAGILKREADQAFDAADRLREGPLAMAKDHEWDVFVTANDHMVDPKLSFRSFEHITYPGKDHPAAAEVRNGMLERKSKYLKNYTPGWYVLSPTHLHEFKSADRIASQAPVMSLYLPEQKLGSHSEPGSSSHKFMLKGRQTGGMHRGHAWVFRAESYDTMMAWYDDIKQLTEKSGKERDAFVRRTHARSVSGSSGKAHSIGGSSDGLEEDEADAQPYSSEQSIRGTAARAITGTSRVDHQYGNDTHDEEHHDAVGWRPPHRPSPGGRFPSDLNMNRGLQAPVSPSSGESSSEKDRDIIAAAGALPGSGMPMTQSGVALQQSANAPMHRGNQDQPERVEPNVYDGPRREHSYLDHQRERSNQVPQHDQQYTQLEQEVSAPPQPNRQAPPTAAVMGGSLLGTAGLYQHTQPTPQQQPRRGESVTDQMDHASAVPAQGTSSPPIMTDPSPATSPPNPIHTDAATNVDPVSSSPAAASGLSTVPTSSGRASHGIDSFRPSGQPDTTDASATLTTGGIAQLPLREVARADGSVATKPVPVRTVTTGTISDLHIPGEYPKTPKVAQ